MLIKSRNFSPTKCEKTFEEDGFGWAPGQEKKFEGVSRGAKEKALSRVRFSKNYAKCYGICIVSCCDKYKPDAKTTGKGCEHCSLPLNEGCQK